MGLAQRLDLPPGRRDAHGQLANRLHQRQQRRAQPVGDVVHRLAVKGRGRARRQRVAAGLDGPAHVVDEQRPRSHQRVAGAHHGEIVLTLLAPVADRGEQLRVEAPQPRQPRGVEPVGLALAAGDQRDLARVGDDHLMAKVRHDAAQPRRAWPCLEHDPRPREAGQRCAQRRRRGADAPLSHHLAAATEDADVGVAVSHVEADGECMPIPALNAPGRCDILLHGRSPTSSRLFRAALGPSRPLFQGASIPLEEETGPHAISARRWTLHLPKRWPWAGQLGSRARATTGRYRSRLRPGTGTGRTPTRPPNYPAARPHAPSSFDRSVRAYSSPRPLQPVRKGAKSNPSDGLRDAPMRWCPGAWLDDALHLCTIRPSSA